MASDVAAPAPLTLTFPSFDVTFLSEASAALQVAQALTVTSDDELAVAADELAAVKGGMRRLEAARTAASKPVNDALRTWNGLFAQPATAFAEAEALLKARIGAYQRAQEEKRLAAEREAERQRREAQAKAEAEARARQAEAERIAREAEEKRRAAEEEARREAAAGNAVRAQEIVAEAHQAAESAYVQSQTIAAEAAAVAEAAVLAPAPAVVIPAPARVSGVSTRQSWKARVTDKAALIRAAAENPGLYAGYLDVNEKALNAAAKAMGKEMQIPGVEVFADTIVASRAR